MTITTNTQALIDSANDTLDDLDGLIGQLQEQYPPTWCAEFNFLDSNTGGFATAGGLGLGQPSASGWQASQISGGYSIYISQTWSPSVELTSLEIDVVYDSGGAGCNLSVQTDAGAILDLYDVSTDTFSWNGSLTASVLYLNPSAGASNAGQVTITRVKLTGTGTNPFSGYNCA